MSVEGSLPVDVPPDGGILAAIEAVLSHYQAPALDGLPPLHGGLVGYLGLRRRPRDRAPARRRPPTSSATPTPSCPWSARSPPTTPGASGSRWWRRYPSRRARPRPDAVTPCTTGRVSRLEDFAAEGAKPIDEPVIDPPDRDDELPPVQRRTSPELYAAAVEAAREYIFAGDIFQVVLAQRFDLELGAEPFDLYRSLAPGQPEPLHVPAAVPRAGRGGLVARADGPGAGRQGHLQAHRRHPPAGPDRRRRPPPGRRADRAPQGAGRARHAGRPGPQRRRPGGRVRHRDGRRAHDPGALQPRDAPDVAGLGTPTARAWGRWTCCGRPCRPGPSRERPR